MSICLSNMSVRPSVCLVCLSCPAHVSCSLRYSLSPAEAVEEENGKEPFFKQAAPVKPPPTPTEDDDDELVRKNLPGPPRAGSQIPHTLSPSCPLFPPLTSVDSLNRSGSNKINVDHPKDLLPSKWSCHLTCTVTVYYKEFVMTFLGFCPSWEVKYQLYLSFICNCPYTNAACPSAMFSEFKGKTSARPTIWWRWRRRWRPGLA